MAACGSGASTGQAESGVATTAGEGSSDQNGDGADDGSDSSASDTDSDAVDDNAGTDSGDGSSGSDGTSETSQSGGATVAPYELTAFDPPTGPIGRSFLAFNADGAYQFENGQATQLINGPISELSTDGAGGILFQRPDSDEVIWWLAADESEPVDLLVTVDPVHLLLEGVTGSGDNRKIVYQRMARTNDPETSLNELKTYRFDDGEVTTLDVVGGWEAGTKITSVAGELATGVWGGEGFNAYYAFDLTAGSRLGSFPEDQWFDNVSEDAVLDGDSLLAVGLLYDEEQEIYNDMGVYRVDLTGQVVETIATFPWDNGSWYPNGLLVDGGVAVISRNASQEFDNDQTPLGPLVVDLATGEATTFPFAVVVRPVS